MTMKIERSWFEKLKEEIAKPYVAELKAFLEQERMRGAVIYPPEELVFNAFSNFIESLEASTGLFFNLYFSSFVNLWNPFFWVNINDDIPDPIEVHDLKGLLKRTVYCETVF